MTTMQNRKPKNMEEAILKGTEIWLHSPKKWLKVLRVLAVMATIAIFILASGETYQEARAAKEYFTTHDVPKYLANTPLKLMVKDLQENLKTVISVPEFTKRNITIAIIAPLAIAGILVIVDYCYLHYLKRIRRRKR